MPDDTLTATLDQIRDRAGVFAKLGPQRSAEPAHGIGAESVNAGYASAADVPLLLAALDEVLKLHHPVDRGAGPRCDGCATHVTFTPWPCRTYEAISRALGTGEHQQEAAGGG